MQREGEGSVTYAYVRGIEHDNDVFHHATDKRITILERDVAIIQRDNSDMCRELMGTKKEVLGAIALLDKRIDGHDLESSKRKWLFSIAGYFTPIMLALIAISQAYVLVKSYFVGAP